MAWLDYDGLLYFWQKIKAKLNDKVDKVEGKGLSSNDFTAAEKNKLAGIEAGANNYSHPTSSGNKHIPSGGSAGQILRWSKDGEAQWALITTQLIAHLRVQPVPQPVAQVLSPPLLLIMLVSF